MFTIQATMNRYTVEDTFAVADEGIKDIEAFLRSFSASLAIINVEKHETFQKKDVDLLWVYLENGVEKMKRIEAKIDRYKSGNFFFETVSNENKGTPGCFLYTEADYLFYYFLEWKSLFVLPVKEIQTWFSANEHRFKEKTLATAVGKDYYTSKGKVVPIKTVLRECKFVKRHSLIEFAAR
ncbi:MULTISPECIES: hypothetical protein [unclassified Exiguobacterium]|uniref:hypothetical protein n=1 Tax=unclassified Exiguobacterium TaxID=2644629 RepID=UPI001BEB624B|nr:MULTISPECIES: hypothetical protein [unclassified Exiguobacterium]